MGRVKRSSDFHHPSQLRGMGGQRGQIKAAFPRHAQLELVRFEVLCGLAKFPILYCFETAAAHSGKGHRTPQATPEMQEVADLVGPGAWSQDIRAKRGQASPGPHVDLPGRSPKRGVWILAKMQPPGRQATTLRLRQSRAAAGWMAHPGYLTGKTNGRIRIPSSAAQRKSDAGDTAWSLHA